jgi:hypothetical protein
MCRGIFGLGRPHFGYNSISTASAPTSIEVPGNVQRAAEQMLERPLDSRVRGMYIDRSGEIG